MGFILILARVGEVRNWAKWREISNQITRYCIFIDVIVKNIINKCFRSWSMPSRDIYIWEETIGADIIKKLGSRIMRIVVCEINVEISH